MKRNIFAALLLVTSLVIVRDASANLLVNGDFEAPVQTFPFFATFNIPAGSTYITGWTVVQGNVDLTTTLNYGTLVNTLDPSTVQDVDLIGDTNAPPGGLGGIAQTFATLVGQEYILTFDYSHNPGSFSLNYAALVTVADANAPANTVLSTVISQPAGPAPWVAFTGTFTANSTSTILSFISTQGGSSGGIYLDDVSVMPVPEPSSILLLVIGSVGCALVRRNRKKAAICGGDCS